MPNQLDDLHDQFDRANQENKRKIGEYLYYRPAQWIARQEIVNQFDIDESGVSRHIDALHEEGFLASKSTADQRYVQWNGRGAGGIEYWIRQAVPPQLWAGGSELRPLLTLTSLGGAYCRRYFLEVSFYLDLLLPFSPSSSPITLQTQLLA